MEELRDCTEHQYEHCLDVDVFKQDFLDKKEDLVDEKNKEEKDERYKKIEEKFPRDMEIKYRVSFSSPEHSDSCGAETSASALSFIELTYDSIDRRRISCKYQLGYSVPVADGERSI